MAEPEDQMLASEPAESPAERQASADELLEWLRRERADFLNYKHRVERERAVDARRTQADTVRQLLNVLDDLGRALAQPPPELKLHPWVQGVALTNRTLIETLRALGVERIGQPNEPFDPERHEALVYNPLPGATEQRVESVIRPGYQLGETLLRPAQVVVVGPGGARGEAPGTIPASDSIDEMTDEMRELHDADDARGPQA
ncbi:MAG TPA: nucleotide exchange factor GrpE [Thermomicrobiales bacterium]|nr:nucleotide exchange factor GrpE [Thermomicrobiales bacterium]